jgi:hypothetical protein
VHIGCYLIPNTSKNPIKVSNLQVDKNLLGALAKSNALEHFYSFADVLIYFFLATLFMKTPFNRIRSIISISIFSPDGSEKHAA